MKYIFFSSLIFFGFSVFAQDDSVDVKFAPTLTEIGKPIGEKITQKIDKDGGRIFSPDKKVELIIPQDAISKKTDISIQSAENTLSPGEGNSYQLEPSGITFQKPLQIIFHYSTDEDVAMPELRNIAWQDDKGQWYQLDNSVVDTIARTVTGNITHFSTWLFFDYFNLKPTSARVKVTKQLNLVIECTYPGRDGIFTDKSIPKTIKFSTYVNGIRGGNGVVGTVSSVAGQTIRNIKYTAPASVPNNNPVALSVEASNITFNRRTYSKLKLISNITIIDKAFEILVTGHNEQKAGRCTITGIDTATCILQLAGSRTRLLDIYNIPFKITISNCNCNIRETNPGKSVGPINIVGAQKIDVVPANPPQKPYAMVTIYFIRNPADIKGLTADPCKGEVYIPVPFVVPAVPFVLQFEAKDEEQTIMKGGDNKNGFEVKVKPVEGDQQN